MNNTKDSASSALANTDILPVLDEIHDRLMAGESVDLEAYIARYPDQEPALRKCAATMKAVADLGKTLGHPSSAKQFDVPSLRRVGEFSIVREIGRGGMGVVYEATQETLERRVALKILPFAGLVDDRALKRFQNEARAAAMLHHPNIVPIHSVGNDKGIHYYAMQFIDGPSIAELIRGLRDQGSPVDHTEIFEDSDPSSTTSGGDSAFHQRETHAELQAAISTARSDSKVDYYRAVADWIRQAADALAHAHESGVLHRDIKPGNLLIDRRRRLWIADFGLARLESDASMTATGDIIGTLRYLSPEQVSSERSLVDHRSDIYALGLTLYELLTLCPAVNGNDREACLRQISVDEPRSPRKVDASIPYELEAIVLKAIEKSPLDRYPSAEALAKDLHRFLQHRPVEARRPTLARRLKKWANRHRTLVGSVGLALAITMAVSVIVMWQAKQQVESAFQQVEAKHAELEDAYAIALNAVDEMYSRFAKEWLREQAQLTDDQKQFLIAAARIYEDIAARAPDDAMLLEKAAEVQLNVADFHHHHGHWGDESKYLRKSLEILSPLVDETTQDDKVLSLYALLKARLAQANLSGRRHESTPESDPLLRDAQAACDRLEATILADPKDVDVEAVERLALIHSCLGTVIKSYDAQQRYARSCADYAQKAIDLGGETENRLFQLAVCWEQLGVYVSDQREQHNIYERERELLERLIQDHPKRDYRHHLAMATRNLSVLERREGNLQQAKQLIQKSIETWSDLFEEFSSQRYLNYLYDANLTLSLVHRDAKEFEEEETALRTAMDLTKRMQVVDSDFYPFEVSLNLARCLSRLGRKQEVAEILRNVETTAIAKSTDGNRGMFELASAQLNVAVLGQGYELSEVAALVQSALKTFASIEEAANLVYHWHPDDTVAKKAFVRHLELQRELLAKDSNNVTLLNHLASIQLLGPFFDESDADEAFRLIQRAHELAPLDEDVQANYGWAYYRRGRFQNARNWFGKTVDTKADIGKALTAFQLGDVATGRKYFEMAVERLREVNAIHRADLSILQEAADACDEQEAVADLLRNRWPGIQGYSQEPSRN